MSKWESSASIPDLSKILLLSQVFGVSTDYLLRDDIEETQKAEIFVEETVEKAAVALFITTGMKMEKYQYIDTEIIELEYGVTGIIKEKKQGYSERYTMGIVIGVSLCIISILPLIVMGAFGLPDHLLVTGIVFLFMIVAVAVYLLIQVCMVRETYDRLLQEGEYTAKAKKIDRKTEKWAAIYWPLVTAVYLGYSLYTFDWGRSWIIWPVAAVFSTVLKAIFGESEEM